MLYRSHDDKNFMENQTQTSRNKGNIKVQDTYIHSFCETKQFLYIKCSVPEQTLPCPFCVKGENLVKHPGRCLMTLIQETRHSSLFPSLLHVCLSLLLLSPHPPTPTQLSAQMKSSSLGTDCLRHSTTWVRALSLWPQGWPHDPIGPGRLNRKGIRDPRKV